MDHDMVLPFAARSIPGANHPPETYQGSSGRASAYPWKALHISFGYRPCHDVHPAVQWLSRFAGAAAVQRLGLAEGQKMFVVWNGRARSPLIAYRPTL